VSAAKVPASVDKALDKSAPKRTSGMAGLSVRNGPVEDDGMDLDPPSTNGASKRKSRSSLPKVSYKDESDSDDAQPLVSLC
jgi:DNA topoisomerase I